jgi:hypothetical protein
MTAAQHLYAQENCFTVLAVQGENSIQKKGGADWAEINTGNKINPGESVKVGINSYIGLLFSNGSSLEIKKGGEYKFEQLKQSIKLNNKSSSRKFTEYVINEFTKKTKESKEMKLTGAVVRERVHYIEIGIPFSSSVIDSSIIFKWYPYGTGSNYIFKLINNHDVTLFMKELTDTTLDCPLNLLHLNKDEYYKWIVFDYNKPEISSDTNYIMIPSPYKLETMRDSINQLKLISGDDSTAINQIIYASFYQNNQLNIDALSAFKKALQLAPYVDVYKKMFTGFLLKMKLYRMIPNNGLGG